MLQFVGISGLRFYTIETWIIIGGPKLETFQSLWRYSPTKRFEQYRGFVGGITVPHCSAMDSAANNPYEKRKTGKLWKTKRELADLANRKALTFLWKPASLTPSCIYCHWERSIERLPNTPTDGMMTGGKQTYTMPKDTSPERHLAEPAELAEIRRTDICQKGPCTNHGLVDCMQHLFKITVVLHVP